MQAFDDIEFLVGSPNRIEVLDELIDGAGNRVALADTTNISRGTITKILGELEDRGWVRHAGRRTYEATPEGELVGATVMAAREQLAAVAALEPIVDCLPWSEISLDPRDLVDAKLTLPSDAAPFAPLSRLNTLSREASVSRTTTPVIDPQAFSISLDRIIDGSLSTEMVVERWVGELFLEQDDLPTAAALDSGLSLYLADESIPLAVSIVDETVVIGVIDDDLAPRALVESDDPSVRDWAEEYFESHRARAKKI